MDRIFSEKLRCTCVNFKRSYILISDATILSREILKVSTMKEGMKEKYSCFELDFMERKFLNHRSVKSFMVLCEEVSFEQLLRLVGTACAC